MKMKRLLGMILSLALMLGLVPGMSLTAYADDPYASLKNSTTVVKFDNKDWYLIDYDASTVTLLSKECIGFSKYASGYNYVEYDSSAVKTEVDDWYRSNISARAKAVVIGNRMFLLTTEQANNLDVEVRKCPQAK